MSYNTEFIGEFDLYPKLDEKQIAYLDEFLDSRHRTWGADKVSNLPDPLRKAVGLPVGVGGEFFVGAAFNSQGTRLIEPQENNVPPEGVPSLYCGWEVIREGGSLRWDGGEGFHGYVGWVEYLIEKFLEPWGIKMTGNVAWRGEGFGDDEDDFGDAGEIDVVNNGINVRKVKFSFE